MQCSSAACCAIKVLGSRWLRKHASWSRLAVHVPCYLHLPGMQQFSLAPHARHAPCVVLAHIDIRIVISSGKHSNGRTCTFTETQAARHSACQCIFSIFCADSIFCLRQGTWIPCAAFHYSCLPSDSFPSAGHAVA
jgi:hypothetical protein